MDHFQIVQKNINLINKKLNRNLIRSLRQVDTVDLPPTAERCSLKTSEYYINSIDTSKIHNARGIDVWANNPPKPWNEKSSTLPRSKSVRLNENS